MSREISRAESYAIVHEAFKRVNFNAFDYDTVKQSLIDYVQLYFPESFNDFIESSEFIAILELFAYISEQIAYRVDVASHENFIQTAQRKDSILRLAKLISYKATRNLPGRGLAKLTSVSTTQSVFDSRGENLAGQTILWNDPNDSDWKEKFILVMNQILRQDFGSVAPNERVQVGDVLLELYQLENSRLTNGVIPFSTVVSGESIAMEAVPVTLNEFGPLEKRPDNVSSFSVLYGNDGLGDASDTTGFFIFVKQGSLQKIEQEFDGVTPNQFLNLDPENVNETDVWLNNIDPDTGETLDDGTVAGQKSGEWQEVDIANAQNIIFNTNTIRNKYEIETLDDDQIRIVFGDGEFANIPEGSFDIWLRTSINRDIVIPQSSINNQTAAFSYVDPTNNTQTLTVTFSLINSLQNSSPSEDIEHIRRIAPAVYFTQDRMVNARDYNTFMLQDPTILKLLATNRTFAGDSQFIAWHDPSQRYDNVKLFGDDLAIYFKDVPGVLTVTGGISGTELLDSEIEPLLSTTGVFEQISLLNPHRYSRAFTEAERTNILAVLDPTFPDPPLPSATPVYIIHAENPSGVWWQATTTIPATYGAITISSSTDPRVVFIATKDTAGTWTVNYKQSSLVVESQDTLFFNENSGTSVVDFDSLISSQDLVTVLAANIDKDRTGILGTNLPFQVVSHELTDVTLPDAGLPNLHQLRVITADTNQDEIPDNVDLGNLIDPDVNIDLTLAPLVVPLPIPYVVGEGDVTVIGNIADDVTWYETNVAPFAITDAVNVTYNTTTVVDHFTVAGDVTATFPNGRTFRVVNSTGNDGSYVTQTSSLLAGYQIVDLGGAATATTSTGLDDSTPGFWTVDFLGAVLGANPTGLNNDATDYTTDVTIDGVGPTTLHITGSSAQTFDALIIALNNALSGATAAIIGGDIRITSATTGATSSMVVADSGANPLFFNCSGFNAIGSATAGTDGSTYTATITFDTGADAVSVVAVNVSTYADLVDEINADLTGGEIVLANGDLRVTSTTTGSTSSVSIVDGGTPVFGSLTLFSSILGAVPGSDTTTTIFVTSLPDSTADGDIILFADGEVLEDIYVVSAVASTTAVATVRDYVYFRRETIDDGFVPVDPTLENIEFWSEDNEQLNVNLHLAKRLRGRGPGLNFLWQHFTTRFNLIDPAATNIIDMFIITRGFYTETRNFLDGLLVEPPETPTSLQLRTDFAALLDNKMISDTVVLHPGVFKVLFGQDAIPELQASINVVRANGGSLTDNEVKTEVVDIVKSFFDISTAEFGETFYFTELAAAIHQQLLNEIDSVVLVPTYANNFFGDLYQVVAREDEIFTPSISVDDITVITALSPTAIRQFQ